MTGRESSCDFYWVHTPSSAAVEWGHVGVVLAERVGWGRPFIHLSNLVGERSRKGEQAGVLAGGLRL